MRFVYVDESGISANEKLLVAAAVIIHADSQCVPVEDYLAGLIKDRVAPEDRLGSFVLSAKELYHGSGKVFGNRKKYPLDKSRQLLKDVLSIPAKFKLPVVYGFGRKEPLAPNATAKVRREALGLDHALIFSLCITSAERFMRKFTTDEVATVTAENNDQTRRTVHLMHDVFRGLYPSYKNWIEKQQEHLGLPPDFYPLTKLRDAVHFVDKSGAFLLQIADACSWIIRCYLEGKPHMDEFVRSFVPRGWDNQREIELVRDGIAGCHEVRCWDEVA